MISTKMGLCKSYQSHTGSGATAPDLLATAPDLFLSPARGQNIFKNLIETYGRQKMVVKKWTSSAERIN